MKPHCTFIGTVSTEPKFIEGQNGKKGFVGVTVESPDSHSQYPNRVKAVFYFNPDTVLNTIKKGHLILIQGDASVETYVSQKTQKTVGVLKIFVKSWESLEVTPSPTPAPKPAARPAAAPATTAPVPEDDVPF